MHRPSARALVHLLVLTIAFEALNAAALLRLLGITEPWTSPARMLGVAFEHLGSGVFPALGPTWSTLAALNLAALWGGHALACVLVWSLTAPAKADPSRRPRAQPRIVSSPLLMARAHG